MGDNWVMEAVKGKIMEAPKDHPDFDISRREWARLILVGLANHKFYGKVTFIMENGVIQRAIKEETIKP